MRFALLLCLLTSALAWAQPSAMSSQAQPAAQPQSSSSSTAPAEEVPTVVKLASQKVTIPPAQIPLTTLDGKEVHLGDYDAKVVVVSLWSTISGDTSFLELLQALHHSYYRGKKDVVILAVNVDMPKNADDVQVLRDITKELDPEYPVLVDKELKLMAYVNERLRPAGMERNTFLVPKFLIFTQKFQKMEQPSPPSGDTVEEEVHALHKQVEQVRLRK
ncbi:MAG: TlpA disulfide reductase family protein [Hyalangium sp.]|uniref:TlpA disulfide reductase family protein n=1 Tax=Hyalangium sp. TaxID=2028555 RepID=UPI00389A6AB0